MVHVAFFEAGEPVHNVPDHVAIVNAGLVVNTHHFLFAAMHTFVPNKKMLCKSISQEFLFNLSPSNNIGESVKTFGDQSGRIAIVDLSQQSREEFETWLSRTVSRPEITDIEGIFTENKNSTAFKSIFDGAVSDQECLSMVAVKAII